MTSPVSIKLTSLLKFPHSSILLGLLFLSMHGGIIIAGDRTLVDLKDFSETEVKSGAFVLPAAAHVHIVALGGGGDKLSSDMFAYGWIIDADTRELVWKMDQSNTRREKDDRKFDDDVYLKKGGYEVYFAAFAFASRSGFSSININIDRRRDNPEHQKRKKDWFFSWFEDFFGKNINKEWKRRSKNWFIQVLTDDRLQGVTTFTPPRDFQHTLFKATRVGENVHIRQGFVLSKPIPIRIHALGEKDAGNELADYGWIIDAKTRERVWAMKRGALGHAGGAEKNVKFDDVVAFHEGGFLLYYNSDDSHSCLDWNAAPPDDPFNYGITLIATDEKDQTAFSLSKPSENRNIILDLTRVGNNETRNATFGLKKECQVRVYALGERSNSRRQMADLGWIINARTREKVWTMEADRTESAGGAEKNRMINELITLPKGTYTAFYQTDDTHAYDDWNAGPPYDPEHWGMTISGEGAGFSMSDVELNASTKGPDIIAQIASVGDGADKSEIFRVDKPTRVRIYALGEGQNREMFDYGWIEDANTEKVIWEMTYGMTFHAGGGRKNRVVNTSLLLDKGEYKLRYISDDSHSYNHWNTDPPDDPTMWGITLYKEE